MDDEERPKYKLPNRYKGFAKNIHQKYVVEPQRKLKHLQEISTHDEHLPELLNLRGFEEIVLPQVALALRNNSKLIFAFIDMDKMKAINDTYGHTKGDEVIRLLGGTLEKYFKREADIIALDHKTEVISGKLANQVELARRGGDEFLLALPLSDRENVHKLLENARAEFEIEASKLTPNIAPSFSFGLAEIKEQLAIPYDQDKVRGGNIPVTVIGSENPEPVHIMLSALHVAEMRMYENKLERGQSRE